MRLQAGDEFLAFAGDGREWRARVDEADRAGLRATVTSLERQAPASSLVVEVWCALVRPQRFEWAVEKCVEAGADVVRPLICDHGARGEGGSSARQARWERIAVEAAEQCGRLTLAAVGPPARLEGLIRRDTAVFFGEIGGRPWVEAARLVPPQGRVAWAVGPEGDWSDQELARLRAAGAIGVSLGGYVLRSETAALVGTALLRMTST